MHLVRLTYESGYPEGGTWITACAGMIIETCLLYLRGRPVILLSIDGEGPIWVTSDNANSMLSQGEDVRYMF